MAFHLLITPKPSHEGLGLLASGNHVSMMRAGASDRYYIIGQILKGLVYRVEKLMFVPLDHKGDMKIDIND